MKSPTELNPSFYKLILELTEKPFQPIITALYKDKNARKLRAILMVYYWGGEIAWGPNPKCRNFGKQETNNAP